MLSIPPELSIDVKQVVDYLTYRLKEYIVEYAGMKNAVIGLSGGVDSSVATYVAKRAVGATHTHVLILPSKSTPREDIEDAYALIELIKIPKGNILRVDIDDYVDALSAHLPKLDRVALGNIKARIRMILLHAYAYCNRGLVVGTGDKSELTIGYFTKFGDGGVDVLPLGDLYKTQVRQIAAHLHLPKRIYTKPSSPALWEHQTAESELGISYELLDRILYRRFDLWWDESLIASELKIPVASVEKVVESVKKTQHKRYPAEIFRLSFRSHGSDWRYPRRWK